MCYSKVASVRAAVIGFGSSFLLYNTSTNVVYKRLALFFAFVTLMQVYDAIYWENGENNMNLIFTKIGMITNHLQPVILAFLLSDIVTFSTISRIILLMYIAFALVYSVEAFKRIQYTKVTKESFPSLFWEWNSLPNAYAMYALFVITISVIAMQLQPPISYIMAIVNILTFAISKFQYKNTEVGRMWCKTASYVPLLLLTYNYITSQH
jgi:hypothetical protein